MMNLVLLSVVLALVFAADSTKPPTKSRSKRLLQQIPAHHSNFQPLDDSPAEPEPITRSKSENLQKRSVRSLDGGRRRLRPLSYDVEITDPTNPLISVVEPRPRRTSAGSSPQRLNRRRTVDIKGTQLFEGMTEAQLKWTMAERYLTYLDAKAHYSKAKFEYQQIKQHLANQK